MLREAQLIPKGVSDTEAYMKVAHLRYLILRTHEWDDAVIDADPPGPREPRSGGRHDGQEASSRVEVAGCSPPASLPTAAGASAVHHQVAAVLRVEELEPRGVHPQLRLLALLHLGWPGRAAPRCGPRRPPSGSRRRPRPAASSRSSADSIVASEDTVKCAYSSEPSDSSTSIFARKVVPRSRASPTSDASSKFSGRMPAISWRPSALLTRLVHLRREAHVAERQLDRVALDASPA